MKELRGRGICPGERLRPPLGLRGRASLSGGLKLDAVDEADEGEGESATDWGLRVQRY